MKKLQTLALTLVALALFTALAVAQQSTERGQPDATIKVGTVSEKSPAVTLKAVGKEVAPGVFEVDPSSIRGKRLELPRGGDQALRSVCIGVWKKGECKGILIVF